MTEKTYTKGEMMAALNKLKTAYDEEAEFGAIDQMVNETEEFQFAIAGAEALIDALDGSEHPRITLINNISKIMLRAMLTRTLNRLDDIDVSKAAEKITTPPEGDA